MNWHSIESIPDLNQALASSKRLVIFKHSTRCAISSMAKSRLERSWSEDLTDIPFYYLDLIKHRDISNYIAEAMDVRHQSPQIILIEDKKAIYNASHSSINLSSVINHN